MLKFWGTLKLITGIIVIALGFVALIKSTTLANMDTISKLCAFGCFVLVGSSIAASGMCDITYNPNNSFGSH